MDIILGIVIGATGYWLYEKSKNDWKVTWLGWVLFVAAALSLVFGVDTLLGSIIEHEMQAGWMGLGLFSILIPVILLVAAWRFGIKQNA